MQHIEGPYVIRHGDVWKTPNRPARAASLSERLEHVCDGTGEMAVAYQGDVLLKVGSAASVEDWFERNRAKFDQMREVLLDMGEDDDDLEVVVIRVPVSQDIVDEINRCIAISGRVAHFREHLERIGEADPSLIDRPTYPR